ncbi:MAG: dihydrodipicolinate synthase family protein [Alphaproteobacteria bacterium]|nr:dihydrodipicolinate synthase family protein [Alphaproteobacteria bacterium]
MKYSKSESKEAARELLKGIWTAMPYCWDEDDNFDDAANRSNMDHVIENIKVNGHYCSGNIAEFWSMPDNERMHAHEVMLDQARNRIPMIAGCHHQSVKQAVTLAKHAQEIGYDFVIILTPYVAARDDETVYQFYEYICSRVDIGIILFNVPQNCHPINANLAKRLSKLPNICGYKQADGSPASTHSIIDTVGKDIVISVADEAPWLTSMTQLGLQWLVNYNPHLYQSKDWLPLKDYTDAALNGEINKATEIAKSIQPLRELHAKWIMGYWNSGRMPISEMKYWQELIGMNGGRTRPPVIEISDEKKQELKEDLKNTGLFDIS